MNRIILSIMLMSGLVVFTACEQKPSGGRKISPNKGGVDTDVETRLVSYENDIQPLLKKKCTSCHAGDQSPDLSTYESARKSAKAIYRTVKAGSMPKAKKDRLSASQVALVDAWINGGMVKSAKKTETPTTALISYDTWVKDYLKKNCIACHGSASDDGDFSTYAKASRSARQIYESMDDGRMPKGSKADASATDKMKSWLDAGAPEKAKSPDGDDEDDEDTEEDKDDAIEGDDTKITYDLNVKKIIGSYCITCHSSGATKPELDSKSKVVAEGDAVLESIKNGSMPKTGPLSDKEKDIIQKWVDGGKL